MNRTENRAKSQIQPIIDAIFPLRVCINLDKRKDRWEKVTKRFASHGLKNVIRFPAVDGSELRPPPGWTEEPGAYGCLLSHLAVVQMARRAGSETLLVFEDDVVFAPGFLDSLGQYFHQLPDDWDMVMFGGIHRCPPEPVASNVSRVTHTLSTFAYVLKRTMYDAFIDLNSRALAAVDDNNVDLQKRFKCYCFMPHLAWVDEDLSDVRHEVRSHWYLSKSLVLWGPEIDEIYKNTVVFIHHSPGTPGTPRSARNLACIAALYLEKLPGITIKILETGEHAALDRTALPQSCGYEFLPDLRLFDQAAAFEAGLRRFTERKNYFLFMDSGVLIDLIDLKPNLLMLKDHDFVTCFERMILLDGADTLRIINNDFRWDYGGKYRPESRPHLCSSACMFTRAGIEAVGGWSAGQIGDVSRRVRELLRVFKSPNGARRLFDGRSSPGCQENVVNRDL